MGGTRILGLLGAPAFSAIYSRNGVIDVTKFPKGDAGYGMSGITIAYDSIKSIGIELA